MSKGHLPLVPHVESNEVIGMIPYLSPELIAAILKLESTSAVDLHVDSRSAMENSFPALRSQSAVNEKPVRVPFRAEGTLVAMLSSICGRWQTGSPLVSIEELHRLSGTSTADSLSNSNESSSVTFSTGRTPLYGCLAGDLGCKRTVARKNAGRRGRRTLQ
jgi:hypothetical protein